MLNISFNPINNSSVSFGARYPLNYLTVEKIIKKYTSLGLKSATDLEMRFPNPLEKDISSQKEFFVNNSNQKIYLDKNNKIIIGKYIV